MFYDDGEQCQPGAWEHPVAGPCLRDCQMSCREPGLSRPAGGDLLSVPLEAGRGLVPQDHCRHAHVWFRESLVPSQPPWFSPAGDPSHESLGTVQD